MFVFLCYVFYVCVFLCCTISLTSLLPCLSLQKSKVRSGSGLKKNPPTPGRRAWRSAWGCQGSGPGTPSPSDSRWPCSCKWQPRSPSTVQVRACHGGHVSSGWVADEEEGGLGGSCVCGSGCRSEVWGCWAWTSTSVAHWPCHTNVPCFITKNRPCLLIRLQLYKITLISFHYSRAVNLCCLHPRGLDLVALVQLP